MARSYGGKGGESVRRRTPNTTDENLPPQARANVERANRQGGEAVGNAVATLQNSGGGEVRVKASDTVGLASLSKFMANPILEGEKGGAAALINGELKVFDAKGKEVKFGDTVTAMVTQNGISVKMMDSLGRFMPPKGKAEISPEVTAGVLEAFYAQKGAAEAQFRADLAGAVQPDGSIKVPAGGLSLGDKPGNLNDYIKVAGTGRTKDEKDAAYFKQRARELGIEGLND
jgi:hypothetical protein